MLKRKYLIFVILITAVISIIIGIFIARMTFENFDKSPKSSVINSADSDSQSDSNGEVTNSNYPFSPYKSFLVNSSGKIVDSLNDNPIDEIYEKKYADCNSPEEEQNVLSAWNSAYENELKNAIKVFENSVKTKSKNNDSSFEDILKAEKDYIDICSEFTDSTAQFAYNFEEFNLGQGTNHTYDLLYNDLELNRTNTLRLIECIYMLDESYAWLKQSN